jgi:protein gp37
MENSKIEWTHHTCNLWIGCTEVHAGCDNCYARVLNHRWKKENWGRDVPRRLVKKVWNDFAKYNRAAKAAGEIHSVFVGSMMDIAEKSMPVEDFQGKILNYKTEAIREWYYNEVIPSTSNLLHLLLSKRPSNYKLTTPLKWLEIGVPNNIMFGTSPVDQSTADTLIPQLLEVTSKRFLSIEPMLGPIDLLKLYGKMERPLDGIDWVIVGGESGGHKRPFDPEWAACDAYKVPFFMKQIDKIKPIPEDLMVRQFPTILF